MAKTIKKSIKSISGTRKKSIARFITSMKPEQQKKHQQGQLALINYLLLTKTLPEEDIEQAKQSINQINDHRGNLISLSDEEKEFFVFFYIENCLRHNSDFVIENYGVNIENINNINIQIILFHAFFEKIIHTALLSKSEKNMKKYLVCLLLLSNKIAQSKEKEKIDILIKYTQNGFLFIDKYLRYLEEQDNGLDQKIKQKIITHKRKVISLLKKIILTRPIFFSIAKTEKNKDISKEILQKKILPQFSKHIKEAIRAKK